MTYILNNFPEEYDVILSGLENCLTANVDDALTIEIICRKLNHCYEKFKDKNEEKREKEKALRSFD